MDSRKLVGEGPGVSQSTAQSVNHMYSGREMPEESKAVECPK